jgi:hypothetical protein
MMTRLCLLLLACLMNGSPARAAQADSLRVWTADSLTRIPQDAPPGAMAEGHLFAARGEYESLQVVVSAVGQSLSGVDFSIDAFNGPGGAVISSEHITAYRQHYVYALGSQNWTQWTPFAEQVDNPPLGDGWYADALIPFDAPGNTFRAAPFEVPAGQSQPLWIDVYVPPGSPAGDYSAAYRVSSDQGVVEGTLRLTVWSFDLPRIFSQHNSFQVWTTRDTASAITLLQHRMQPMYVEPAEVSRLREDWGLRDIGLGFWGQINYQACAAGTPMPPPPDPDEVRRLVEAYPPGTFLYNQSVDEIDACLDQHIDSMIAWDQVFDAFGVPQAVAMSPTDKLLYTGADGQRRSAVEIWVVLPLMMEADPQAIAAAQARGEQVWSYAALVQDDYSPKWVIDYPLINYRLMQGFINQSLGLTGYMYWAVDTWTDDPWNRVNISPDPADPDFVWPPGDGMLFYPGEAVGLPGALIPSIRAKIVRDGFEDYEYVQMLRDAGQSDLALSISRSIGADWRNWTREPDVLAAGRAALAGALAALHSGSG